MNAASNFAYLLNIDLFVDFDNSETILKSLDLINVKSILPVSYFTNPLSFNINLGYKDDFYETDNRGNFYGELGIGKAYTFIDLITPLVLNKSKVLIYLQVKLL